jgi:hypothetical protein
MGPPNHGHQGAIGRQRLATHQTQARAEAGNTQTTRRAAQQHVEWSIS